MNGVKSNVVFSAKNGVGSMQRWNVLRQVLSMALIVCVLCGCGGGNSLIFHSTHTGVTLPQTPIPTIPTRTIPVPTSPGGVPVPGQWAATAPGLGTFSFTVSQDSTTITELDLSIPHLTCGGSVMVGNSIQVGNSWPVDKGQFTLDPLSQPLFDLTLTGKFDATGKSVVGTWKVNSMGTTCPGTWTGNTA